MKTTTTRKAEAPDVTTLEDAQVLIGREFTVHGMRHRITDAWIHKYTKYGIIEVALVEVRIWTSPNRSHSEILELHELNALIRQAR